MISPIHHLEEVNHDLKVGVWSECRTQLSKQILINNNILYRTLHVTSSPHLIQPSMYRILLGFHLVLPDSSIIEQAPPASQLVKTLLESIKETSEKLKLHSSQSVTKVIQSEQGSILRLLQRFLPGSNAHQKLTNLTARGLH